MCVLIDFIFGVYRVKILYEMGLKAEAIVVSDLSMVSTELMGEDIWNWWWLIQADVRSHKWA